VCLGYFRLSSESGAIADIAALTLRAITGPEQSQQKSPLLNHLVGAGKQAGGKVQLTIRSGSAKEEMRRERAQPLD